MDRSKIHLRVKEQDDNYHYITYYNHICLQYNEYYDNINNYYYYSIKIFTLKEFFEMVGAV